MATTESLAGRDGLDEPAERDEPAEHDEPNDHLGATGFEFDGENVETTRGSVRARTDAPSGETGWLWKAVAALGLLSLLGAVAVVALPGTLVQPVQFTTETVRSLRSIALLLGAFVGIFGSYVAYHRDPGDDETEAATAAIELPAANPEHGSTDDAVGAQLDRRLDRIGGMVGVERGDHYTAYKVERTLESLAVRVVAEAVDCPEARARRHVARGTWTDDVRAASFLGGPDVPERTLAMRIRDWASGSTFDRQVRATVDELAELAAGEKS